MNGAKSLNDRGRRSPTWVSCVGALAIMAWAGITTVAVAAQPVAPSWGAAVDATVEEGASPDGLAQSSPEVRVPETLVLLDATSVEVQVEAVAVQGLGATTTMVGYDTDVLEVLSCQRGAAFDLGLCNKAFDRDGDGKAETVRFNAVALEGVDGSARKPVVLARITFGLRTRLPLGATTPLRVSVETFTDTDGVPLRFTARDGQLRVVDSIATIFLPITRRPPR
jgi:hypothetical protein